MENELCDLINRHNVDLYDSKADLHTADIALAHYLAGCLRAWSVARGQRSTLWTGQLIKEADDAPSRS